MSDGMNREKWNEMDKQKKLTYYKTYYLIPTIIVLVILVFIVNSILDMTVRKKESLLDIASININTDTTLEPDISDGYINFIEGNLKKEKISFGSYFLNSDISTTALSTAIGAQALDVVILNDSELEYFADDDYFADLSVVLTEEKYAVIEDQVVGTGYTNPEDGDEYPAMIDISGTALAEEYCPGEDTVYLAAIVNSTKLENFPSFVDYVFSK